MSLQDFQRKLKALTSMKKAYKALKLISLIKMQYSNHGVKVTTNLVRSIEPMAFKIQNNKKTLIITFVPTKTLCSEFFKKSILNTKNIITLMDHSSYVLNCITKKPQAYREFIREIRGPDLNMVSGKDLYSMWHEAYETKIFCFFYKSEPYYLIVSNDNNRFGSLEVVFRCSNWGIYSNKKNNDTKMKNIFSRSENIKIENMFVDRNENIYEKLNQISEEAYLRLFYYTSLESEHLERLQVAEGAVKNIEDIYTETSRKMSKFRQEKITKDLSTIVSAQEMEQN